MKEVEGRKKKKTETKALPRMRKSRELWSQHRKSEKRGNNRLRSEIGWGEERKIWFDQGWNNPGANLK